MTNTDKHHNGSANLHSTDNEKSSSPGTIVIINCVLNAPLMLISILGNALVLAAMIRTPSIRSTSMIMLCSLAVSDLLVGFLAQPIYIANKVTEESPVTHVSSVIGAGLVEVSFVTMTAITVDRFLALHYHMRYAALVTKSRIKYTVVMIWLITFLVSGFHFFNPRIQHFLISVCIIICLIISTFSYIIIYRIVRRHQLQIHAQQQAVQSSNADNNLNMARLKRSAINFFLFYIVFTLCYFPWYILLTLYGISDKDWQREWDFATTLVFSNSSINPFLYCWRLRELRTAVVKTARQMLCKQTEETQT